VKTVELSDLKEKLLLAEQEALAVEHNGKLLGYFYPKSPKNQAEADDLWERLDKALDRAAAESGMDREALIDTLDPTKPFPF